MISLRKLQVSVAIIVGLYAACSGNPPASTVDPGTAGKSTGGESTLPNAGKGGLNLIPFGGEPSSGGETATPLTGVTKTESGGYKLGPELGSGGEGVVLNAADGCGVLVGVARDFRSTGSDKHPDFEAFGGQVVIKGLVGPELDADHKPVYASKCEAIFDGVLCPTGQQTTDKTSFDQWYRDTPDVNKAYLMYFQMEPIPGTNVVSFQSDSFFPFDGTGWDGADSQGHNYGFTTELHIKFKYSGGESFTFNGDDDVWAFINGKLAIDLGGLHSARTDTVLLDDVADILGLVKGNVYPLELFHAERHSVDSHFRMDSTLSVVDCGTVVDPPK